MTAVLCNARFSGTSPTSRCASCEPYSNTTDTTLKVCGTSAKGKSDSICPGDSGGPLVADGVLIGIVSTGNKYCDTQYPVSVFTKVSTVAPALGLKQPGPGRGHMGRECSRTGPSGHGASSCRGVHMVHSGMTTGPAGCSTWTSPSSTRHPSRR